MVMEVSDINELLESSLSKLIIDKNGNILGMTKAFKNMVGEKAIPNHMSEIFDDLLIKKIHSILESTIQLQSPVEKSLIGHLKLTDENYASCYIIYQPEVEMATITMKNDEKEPVCQIYENTFNTTLTPLAIVNEWGFFVTTNTAFYKIFRYPSSDDNFQLKTFIESFQHYERFCYTDYFLRAKSEAFSQVKVSYQLYGETKYFNLILQLDAETEKFVLKVEDVTEKEHLLDLLAHSDQLCTTGEIAASIAHEVRNPMTTLQGFLQLLEHEVTGNAHKYVTVIQEEVKRMNEILNELLMLSKPMVDEITVFSLSVLVEEVLILLRPKALLDQINIVNEKCIIDPVFIKANPNRIKQVLVNLLKNAMEAMEPNGTLNIKVIEVANNKVEVCISDTGTGMSEDMMENIFLPFVTEKEGGTGLGLPFVKKTMLEYGGTISVTSEIGKGSAFQLSFPRIDVSLSEVVS
ncbi:ATP-binding protein [Sporosarcina sp. GW1-11]|uniref:ATP-binding protein n=1 Tax=Sporosarcina sp. GW1-11 TaxID=2899126 RepID=UPI00294F835F|nr:ATP-binding protein [Sporosarcina sp. GW1-11]MDV6376874.1 ATP-binding protein [Sporosarcina sp. GW1-11]